jgi:Galactose oxidase-like, Early set domain
MLTLADGDLFVASGVEKLLKPVYPDRPFGSGTNVTETETYDVSADRWTDNGASAKRTLPLFPRLHLLPDGHVFYDAAGQSFNPFGQSYDMALWNIAAAYDPSAKRWTSLGIPGLNGVSPDGAGLDVLSHQVTDLEGLGVPGLGPDATIPGYRGSTFSLMMPLEPNADGSYTKASFLTAGGVLGYPVASPGSYVATSDSRLTTIDTAAGDAMTTTPTGDLSRPRWYSSAVLLPTGEVIAFNGSDRDAVVGPGVEYPIRQAELYDPATRTWRPIAQSHQPRTYHNTAALLPDGRVLVGGHAPITTLYLSHIQLPGGFGPNDGRDPSFELFKPPYLFRGPRPKIVDAPAKIHRGHTFDIEANLGADQLESVVLMRNTALTHLIDGDQRAIELPVVASHGVTVTVEAPPTAAVAPDGPYQLYLNRSDADGPVPSKGHQLFVR